MALKIWRWWSCFFSNVFSVHISCSCIIMFRTFNTWAQKIVGAMAMFWLGTKVLTRMKNDSLLKKKLLRASSVLWTWVQFQLKFGFFFVLFLFSLSEFTSQLVSPSLKIWTEIQLKAGIIKTFSFCCFVWLDVDKNVFEFKNRVLGHIIT